MKNDKGQIGIFDVPKKEIAPLAERMRPDSIDGFVGQSHIIAENSLLRRAIRSDKVGSCIFWGPPGTGKTTLANIIANSTGGRFVKLNAVTSGVADAKRVIDEAATEIRLYSRRTYLLLDECHRWRKDQSDCVLQAIEQGTIIFIGSTTENPYAAMTPAIVSRCRVFEFFRLQENDIVEAVKKAMLSPRGLKNMNVQADEQAVFHIARVAAGDLRNAYNILELAALTTKPSNDGVIHITREIAAQSSQTKPLSVDTDIYYGMISAFCKSLRGSDADAALFWFLRLVNAGCDPMLLVRRLVVHSCEDVGLADPNALVVSVSAMEALKNIGLPEAKIPISAAIIYVCNAPKSNSVVRAIEAVEKDVADYPGVSVPKNLLNNVYKRSTDNVVGEYLYPHDKGGWLEQQYLPDELISHRYYVPSNNGMERESTFKEGFVGRQPRFNADDEDGNE